MAPLFDDLQKLPPSVREHLYSEALERWYADAQERWALPEEQRPDVEGAALEVYTRNCTLDRFIARVVEVVGDRDRAMAIVIDILGNDFLKIQDYLGVDIVAYIRTLGGDPAKYVKEIVAGDLVQRVLAAAGLAGADAAIRKRVEVAAIAFMTGVRLRPATAEILARSVKVGGAGLDPKLAETFVAALDETVQDLRKSGVTILKEARPVTPQERSTFHLVLPTKGSMVQPEDEAEIMELRRSVPDVADRGSYLDATIDRVIVATGAKFKDADVERRFRRAVESRLRDIRDHQETLDLFTRAKDAGGLGIPRPVAEKVIGSIEEELRTLHPTGERRGVGYPLPSPQKGSRSSGRADMGPAPTSVQSDTDPQTPDTGLSRTNAPQEVSPVLQVPSTPAPTTAIVGQLVHPVPPKPPPPPPVPQPSMPRPDPTPRVAAPPRSPTYAVPSASRPLPPPPVSAPPPISPPVVRQIPVSRPPPLISSVDISTPAKAPTGALIDPRPPVVSAKPRLQDIRSVPPRLVGPIEELGRLTVADFRKIARAPTEAAARLLEKLALLEKEAYSKRADGIRALRGSALMTTYADVLNTALLGRRTIDAELSDRASQDHHALTKQEFEALKSLNAQLRF